MATKKKKATKKKTPAKKKVAKKKVVKKKDALPFKVPKNINLVMIDADTGLQPNANSKKTI